MSNKFSFQNTRALLFCSIKALKKISLLIYLMIVVFFIFWGVGVVVVFFVPTSLRGSLNHNFKTRHSDFVESNLSFTNKWGKEHSRIFLHHLNAGRNDSVQFRQHRLMSQWIFLHATSLINGKFSTVFSKCNTIYKPFLIHPIIHFSTDSFIYSISFHLLIIFHSIHSLLY
ncbi:hypothetical protein EGR_04358 [Echinococcus granulosus]|uniref:Uncharacterized protein n=1 Tax=Echinococcus granulosus TaxID=6210 RepID=W6UQY9_ECHGR|nr:hypothetical protein EGR_04358 [Echinococcus granulosus]EUB60732.1 hypothetical protein EGR_04358 [Echinococcus granulosus]